ncbi:hypothetical protein D3C86_1952490 [compost metagenome]
MFAKQGFVVPGKMAQMGKTEIAGNACHGHFIGTGLAQSPTCSIESYRTQILNRAQARHALKASLQGAPTDIQAFAQLQH